MTQPSSSDAPHRYSQVWERYCLAPRAFFPTPSCFRATDVLFWTHSPPCQCIKMLSNPPYLL